MNATVQIPTKATMPIRRLHNTTYNGAISRNEQATSASHTRSSQSRIGLILLLIGLGVSGPAFAQTATLAPAPFQTFLDNSGRIVSGGCVWTYTAGTSTPATTYQDQAAATPNTNPIRSSSDGRFVAYLLPGSSYKFVYENTPCSASSHGSVLKTIDNIGAVPVAGLNVDVSGTAGETLTAGQAVYLSDGSGGKTAGLWYRADSANTYSSSTAGTVGFTTAAVASGSAGSFRTVGRLTNLAGLTVGAAYYIGAAGAITSTAPTNVRRVGDADSTTSLVISQASSSTSSTAVQTTTLTGSQNNFAATSARRLVLFANNATALTLTGIAAGNSGDTIELFPVGIAGVTLADQNAGSSAANRLITGTGADLTLSAGTGSTSLTYDGSSARWRVAARPSVMQLLKANSGTDSNAAATNVDTVALAGLTAKDTLVIKYTLESATQATTAPTLYNATDSVTVSNIANLTNIAAGGIAIGNTEIRQQQSAATAVTALNEGANNATNTFNAVNSTFATPFTGAWTLALRHGGVTAGGTFKWSWSVYVIRGQ
jgi:hypothetical protein